MKIIRMCNTDVRLIDNGEVESVLRLDEATDALDRALSTRMSEQPRSRPRVRVEGASGSRDAWVHTLRATWPGKRLAGGKDYTSIGFKTPAMWVTLLSLDSGLPIAFLEADFLSRVRTAAVAAVATRHLAPKSPRCVVQFGAGKIAELLMAGTLAERSSIEQVFLIREHAGRPDWLDAVAAGRHAEVIAASDSRRVDAALSTAEMVTTATSSRSAVIPRSATLPKVGFLCLMGSNRLDRREIDRNLARRCVPPYGVLVADDPEQCRLEAGDFRAEQGEAELNWSGVPSLGEVIANGLPAAPHASGLLAFKSVGIGSMDVVIAAAVLERCGGGVDRVH